MAAKCASYPHILKHRFTLYTLIKVWGLARTPLQGRKEQQLQSEKKNNNNLSPALCLGNQQLSLFFLSHYFIKSSEGYKKHTRIQMAPAWMAEGSTLNLVCDVTCCSPTRNGSLLLVASGIIFLEKYKLLGCSFLSTPAAMITLSFLSCMNMNIINMKLSCFTSVSHF